MIDVNYINDQDIVNIPEGLEEILESVILKTLDNEGIDNFCEISIMFVDNKKIRVLNLDYRNKDVETDVLSFPQYDTLDEIKNEREFLLLGDVVISLEKAVEQANDFGHTLIREISYLTAHSILHLLGYDHMDEDEKAEMREKEESILNFLEIFR